MCSDLWPGTWTEPTGPAWWRWFCQQGVLSFYQTSGCVFFLQIVSCSCLFWSRFWPDPAAGPEHRLLPTETSGNGLHHLRERRLARRSHDALHARQDRVRLQLLTFDLRPPGADVSLLCVLSERSAARCWAETSAWWWWASRPHPSSSRGRASACRRLTPESCWTRWETAAADFILSVSEQILVPLNLKLRVQKPAEKNGWRGKSHEFTNITFIDSTK